MRYEMCTRYMSKIKKGRSDARMKRALENDALSPLDLLPDEILQAILVSVHHTVSHHNTVCRRHYRLLMTYDGWLAQAITNYAHFIVHRRVERLVSDNFCRSYFPRIVKTLARIDEAVKKEPRYSRFANAWAYRMNAKIEDILPFNHPEYWNATMIPMLLDYCNDLEDSPLKFFNFHPRDFYISFTEVGHVYALVVRDEKDGRFRTVFSPKLSDTEANDDESECPSTPRKKTYPDPYSESYGLRSTTTDIGTLFAPFNETRTIARMMRRPSWHDAKQNKYFGMTAQEVSDEWERIRSDASTKGTAMHLNLEHYLNGVAHETESKEFQLFRALERDHIKGKLRPFRTEWMAYHDDLHLCGSADILFEYIDDMDHPLEFYDPILNPTPRKKRLVMGDHKRSKEIHYAPIMARDADAEEAAEWYGCVPCTAMLSNCNFVKYACQMCYYKEYFEAHYEVVIDNEMFLFVLHPQQLTYLRVLIRADQMAPFMPGIFQHRWQSLQINNPT